MIGDSPGAFLQDQRNFNRRLVETLERLSIEYGVKADLYVAAPTGIDQSAMSRKRRMPLYSNPYIEAWFLAPENVILYKLDYFKQSEGASQKHPIDIAKMLAVIGHELDLTYLEEWARITGVLELWQALWDEFKR
jgi:hypothetical protein